MKTATSFLIVSSLAITLSAPAHAQQATITACKPGTSVRLWKHFMSIRASARIACGSTVEVLKYERSLNIANVRQGSHEGYVEAWHINLGGGQANTAPQSALGTFLQTIAQGLQAIGNTGMSPNERLARTCFATPGCAFQVESGQQWVPVTQAEQTRTYPQTSNFRMSNGSTFYTSTVVQASGTFKGHSLPSPSSPALVLDGGGMSLAIVNGYAYTLGTDGQWHPTGLGPGKQQGVEGVNP
jgi:hypothetical protein